MNNQDYEQKKKKCWLQFCREKGIDKEVNISIYEAFDSIFDCAYALGKQTGNPEQLNADDTVIQGWVARDRDGEIYLYEDKPVQCSDEWAGRLHSEFDFQKLRWPSDPIEVEIIIKRKKK